MSSAHDSYKNILSDASCRQALWAAIREEDEEKLNSLRALGCEKLELPDKDSNKGGLCSLDASKACIDDVDCIIDSNNSAGWCVNPGDGFCDKV